MCDPDTTAARETLDLVHAVDGGDADFVQEALADRQRREALSYAVRADVTRALDDLATHLVTTGRGRTSLEDTPETIAVQLRHIHVPKLVDAGLVRYDTDNRLVEATEFRDELRPFFD